MDKEHHIGTSSCASDWDAKHLFGGYGDPSVPSTFPSWETWTTLIEANWGLVDSEPKLYRISGRGKSSQRLEPNAALSPLPSGQVGERAGYYGESPFSKLAIGITGMGTAYQPIIIDGDQTVEVYASKVTVAALTPPGWVDVASPSRANPEVPAGTVAIDEEIGVKILATDVSLCQARARLTTSIFVAAGDQGQIVIPRGAVKLRVYGPGGQWTWSVNLPNGGPVFWDLGGFTFFTTPFEVPQCAALVVEPVFEADRLFTLVWEIES